MTTTNPGILARTHSNGDATGQSDLATNPTRDHNGLTP